jgi:hypothetical protein
LKRCIFAQQGKLTGAIGSASNGPGDGPSGDQGKYDNIAAKAMNRLGDILEAGQPKAKVLKVRHSRI